MRFRKLTLDELKELHEEFIQFLSSNTITGDDWGKIKEDDYDKTDKLIDIFSDIVLEKSLVNIRFLEKREPKNLLLFHCKEKEIDLVGLSVSEGSSIDFTNSEHLEALSKSEISVKINTFKTSKAYSENREDEVYKMLNDGCLITDEKLFKALFTLS